MKGSLKLEGLYLLLKMPHWFPLVWHPTCGSQAAHLPQACLRTHLLNLLFESLLQVLVTPDQFVKNLSGQDINGFSDDSLTRNEVDITSYSRS